MNDKIVVAAGIVAAGAVITSAVQTIRVSNLKSELRMKEVQLNVWKNGHKRALKKMNGAQILDLLSDSVVDMKFHSITNEF